MNKNLNSFLCEVGANPQIFSSFQENPAAVMDQHGLSEEYKQLILEGDKGN